MIMPPWLKPVEPEPVGSQGIGRSHLGRRRAIAQRGVRPERVVVPSPLLDEDLGLGQGVEHLG
ncbi:MAG: hypothetical protein JWO24_3438, partial [Rhodospirillales bacterium]|nr:hypothetical protein [Rhodospirillales bacterium]